MIGGLEENNKDLTDVLGTTKIELDKVTEFYKNTKSDLEESMDRLHTTNRIRHELEIRLHAELEASYRLK